MNKITPFLWFDGRVEEAMSFYTTVFKNSKIISINKMGDNGTILSATFEIEGQRFMALNGGHHFKFTEAISFFINCETQQEVDELWESLSEGGVKGRCGWLKDKFGISWQVVPSVLGKLMSDPNKNKAGKVIQAMLKMDKLIIADLNSAYEHND